MEGNPTRKQGDSEQPQTPARPESQRRAVESACSETKAVLAAIGDAMVFFAPGGQVLSANPRFRQMFALDEVGDPMEEFESQIERIFGDVPSIRSLLGGATTGQEASRRQTVTQYWPESRELEVHSTPVRDDQGEYLGRLCAFYDAGEGQEVDRLKGEFVSTVSHELRTPLTSIKGYVDLIVEGDAGEISEEQREYLSIVKQNADRLVDLINDLLDISDIEYGRIRLDMQPVNVGELLQQAAVTSEAEIRQKCQTLSVTQDPLVPSIIGDRDRLLQVVNNLLSNAYKYTPSGGVIRMEAGRKDQSLCISVSDNGIGISSEDQEKLFARFYRVDNSLTRRVGGTGLGLTLVKAIVAMHGGSVAVVSEVGSGSTFSVFLPIGTEPMVDSVEGQIPE